jgi:hypothetical protein
MTARVKRAPKIFTLLPAEYDIMRSAGEFVANDMIVLLPNPETHFVWPRGSTENRIGDHVPFMLKRHTLTFERDDICDARYLDELAETFQHSEFFVKVSSKCLHLPVFLCATAPGVRGLFPLWYDIVVSFGKRVKGISIRFKVDDWHEYLDTRRFVGNQRQSLTSISGDDVLMRMWAWFESRRSVKSWLLLASEKNVHELRCSYMFLKFGLIVKDQWPPFQDRYAASFAVVPARLENLRADILSYYARHRQTTTDTAEKELEIVVAPFGYRPVDYVAETELNPTVSDGYRQERARGQKIILYKKISLTPRLVASWCVDAGDVALALFPLRLPAYVVLWILQWLHPTLLVFEKPVVDAIQRTHTTCWRLMEARDSTKHARQP